MRTQIATLFHDTVNFCFSAVLESMGSTVRDSIYDFLDKKGIARDEISTRFDDVAQVLEEAFGSSARIILYKTLIEIHREYSLRADFTYQESVRDRMSLVKDRVVADHLYPKHAQKANPLIQAPTSFVPGHLGQL